MGYDLGAEVDNWAFKGEEIALVTNADGVVKVAEHFSGCGPCWQVYAA